MNNQIIQDNPDRVNSPLDLIEGEWYLNCDTRSLNVVVRDTGNEIIFMHLDAHSFTEGWLDYQQVINWLPVRVTEIIAKFQ